jgi:hypothetical protein
LNLFIFAAEIKTPKLITFNERTSIGFTMTQMSR